MQDKKVLLIIMDGWGIAKDPELSAIHAAHTPFYDGAIRKYPFSKLQASGEAVGLPEGQMGNSEVGHMNIGAGRIVDQELLRIGKAFREGAVASKPVMQHLIKYCRKNKRPLHLMGLLSDGGIHSHLSHLYHLLELFARQKDFPPIYLHCFTDGRDTSPEGGISFIRSLELKLKELGVGKIASLIGRYYAMDRNNKWERTAKAYQLLVNGVGEKFNSAEEAVMKAYEKGDSDEFIPPVKIGEEGNISEGDAVLFYNFRTDRGRQLTRCLTQEDHLEVGTKKLPLHFVTMTAYDPGYKNVEVLFESREIKNGLGEVLAAQNKNQIRIAETEKYPHVTFFFNGGREMTFVNEKRILCPSPPVATYDLKPEMSAYEIEAKVVAEIKRNWADFICLNFANPDMVGHTGVFEAAVKACETVDSCVKTVATVAQQEGYDVLVTADHGNADKMKNEDGSVHTAHTTAEVPLYFIPADNAPTYQLKSGKLGDLAPTILYLMGIAIPKEMAGKILIKHV